MDFLATARSVGIFSIVKNKTVKSFWEGNPFTYKGDQGVGYVQVDSMTLEVFEKIERKLRKHGSHYQAEGAPLYSRIIDYPAGRGKRILDVATGSGVIAVEMARQGMHVTAIDLTEWAVSAARKNFDLRELEGDIRQMDAQSMSFNSEAFDMVNAAGCLMHMPETEKAVSEIFRVMKPEAKVTAWLYHKGWYYYFNTLIIRGILLGGLLKYKFNLTRLTSRYTDGSHDAGNPHTVFYGRGELERMFKKAGFRAVQSEILYNPCELDSWPMVKLGFGKYLPEWLRGWIGRRMGLGILVRAEK